MTVTREGRAIFCLISAFFLVLLPLQCRGQESKQLLKYDNLTKKFLLDSDALAELSSLKAPIKIIAAIGDARVGKSTSLNMMRHFWKGESRQDIEEVFKTSNEMAACTRGVWVSVLPDDAGSVVFLDVEGSNLGDDAKTNQFSIFATLLSSSLMLFAEEAVTNHNRDFLFRVTRLTEEIWRDQMRDRAVNHFPSLRVVLRQSLDPPEGVTLEQFIVSSMYGVKDEKSEILRKYFSNDKLAVSTISYNKELKKSGRELEALNDNAYRKDVMSLVRNMMTNMPFKETINGATMNGKMIQELAKKLVEALNKNSWVLFSDTYTMMEKTLCDNALDSLITPMQNIDYHSIVAKRRDVMKEFSGQCVLEAEKRRAEGWIDDVIDGKQKAEAKERQMKEQQRLKEEEERRQREIEAERQREEERQRQRMEQERRNREAAERRKREEEERARKAEESRRQAQRNLEEIERAKRKAKKKKNDVVKVLGVIAGVAAIFSDERLKQNITTIPGSEYERIGLRGATWVWNEKAQALGMRGEGQGVIAQEVEKVYPQAVMEGSEGFKRVYYSFLENLLDKN